MTEQEQVPSYDPGDKLGPLLVVAGTKTWLALITIGVVILGILVWSFVGSIPVQVMGTGVVMNSRGVFSIEAGVQGTVKEILVQAGDKLKENQTLIHLSDPQEETRLQTARLRVQSWEKGLSELTKEIRTEAQAEKEAVLRDIKSIEFRIQSIKQELPKARDALKRRNELYENGLLSIEAVRQAEGMLMEREINLEASEAQLSALHSRLKKSYRHNEITARKRELLQAKHELELLEERHKQFFVSSPKDGRILEVLVQPGQVVGIGEPLAWVETQTEEGNEQLIYAYVPVEAGKRIELGNKVYVDVSTINAQEFGMVIGTVIEISPYAISPEGIIKTVHNRSLGEYLMGGRLAVIQVIVQPNEDPYTVSGLAWTSGEGPPEKLTTGTICTVKAVVEEVTPIHYIFPMWRLKKLWKDKV